MLQWGSFFNADGDYVLSEVDQAGHYRLQYTSSNLFHQTAVNAYVQAVELYMYYCRCAVYSKGTDANLCDMLSKS